MPRTCFWTTALASVLLALSLHAQDLDKGYITAFGWGSAAVAQEKAPALASYEAGLFTYRNGTFFITAGADADMHIRFLLAGGKSYGQHLAALKKATAKKTGTLKKDYIRTLLYVSHDESGAQLFTKWPSSMSDLPQWKEIATNELSADQAKDWVSSRFSLRENQADMTSLISWLKKARPGWKIYVVHVAGYTRDAPELKYYDKAELRWMIPLEYVDTAPLAVATIEVEKSTNPMLAWSYTIDRMPAAQKGEKDGRMTVLKNGSPVATFAFGIEYRYQNQVTKLHNFVVHYTIEKDEDVIGGFTASDVPTIENGIENTFFEAVESALFNEKLK